MVSNRETSCSPCFPSISLAVLLMFAFNDCDTSIYLRFRTSGKVYNLRRFDAKTKNFETLIRELLYADDAVFVAHMHSIDDMQLIMFTCTALGLTISLKRRKRCSHLHQANNIVSQT